MWVLLFSASDVSGQDLPEPLEDSYVDQQHWGLYTPEPSESYSWYPTEARLANGSAVDARGGTLSFDRPPDASAEYETFRHRKFVQDVRDSGWGETDGPLALQYAEWLCERAETEYDARVERVTVYRMYQPSPLDGEYVDPSKLVLVERGCRS